MSNIIHLTEKKDHIEMDEKDGKLITTKKPYYRCNHAVGHVTPDRKHKATRIKANVTCKNCIRWYIKK